MVQLGATRDTGPARRLDRRGRGVAPVDQRLECGVEESRSGRDAPGLGLSPPGEFDRHSLSSTPVSPISQACLFLSRLSVGVVCAEAAEWSPDARSAESQVEPWPWWMAPWLPASISPRRAKAAWTERAAGLTSIVVSSAEAFNNTGAGSA